VFCKGSPSGYRPRDPDERVRTPGLVHQLLPAERAVAMPDETRQHLELERRQRHDGICPSDLAAVEVDLDVAEGVAVGRRILNAAEDGVDSRAQFAGTVGLPLPTSLPGPRHFGRPRSGRARG
jgi:hypothetical protein